MEKVPTVYIVASQRNGTVYTGVTSDLMARIHQHRTKAFKGFTAKHSCDRLVWFEVHETMASAILREKQVKNWRRDWKLALIEQDNPRWYDLAETLGFEPLIAPQPSSRT
ncbi:GIY-YIG nuclease family protein [Sphingomonas japonica]|uniref:Endonuclease n=1 Tax=Sphingomonas japonica TaxID=511662 RepID=A0ABX0U408_9SPHN|nr:GIY-YIG nuclease family protein [Sphingomonas japonica]NIJ24396.1 putative endonuclease [Sphingomonas japonica]